MADQLQELIRSLPPSFTGAAAADFTRSVATQIRTQAPGLQGPSNWFDFGEGSTIYSVDKIIGACNELELYGQSLADQGGTFKKGSFEYNRVITLLGNVYGFVGGRVAVNATLAEAQSQFVVDIGDNAKNIGAGILDYSKWIIVGVIGVAVIIILTKYGRK